MVGRTTVVVAHRLSTVRNADVIAVVHEGKIVEFGNHENLISNPDGAYSALLRLQEASSLERNPSLDRTLSRPHKYYLLYTHFFIRTVLKKNQNLIQLENQILLDLRLKTN